MENDFFFGRDENYTNGVQFGYISNAETSPSLFSRVTGYVAGGQGSPSCWRSLMGTDNGNTLIQQWSLTLTHLMFTPSNGHEYHPEPLYNEHPYGAWLGLGMGGLVKTEDRATTFSLHVGITGKAAGGHSIQDIIHRWKDNPKWQGWENEIPSEVVFQLSLQKKYRLHSLENTYANTRTDGHVFWDVSAGTMYMRLGGGAYMRWGYNMPAYSPMMGWDPGTYQTAPFANMPEKVGPWSYYLFCGARTYVNLYDVFLDGPMFSKSTVTVDKYYLKADISLGLAGGYKDFEMIFGCTMRTREYKDQVQPQFLGTLMFRYTF